MFEKTTVGNSLQDQLFKAGLANKKQAVKARKAQNNKEKLQRQGKAVTDEAAELAEKARQEQVARDRELNRIKQVEAEAKAVKAQIRQLIKLNQIEERGDTEFSFTHGTQIKSLHLRNEHRDALIKGQLAIVTLDDNYAIVPATVSDKISQRDESLMVLRHSPNDEAPIDDEYADYEVPDDLMW